MLILDESFPEYGKKKLHGVTFKKCLREIQKQLVHDWMIKVNTVFPHSLSSVKIPLQFEHVLLNMVQLPISEYCVQLHLAFVAIIKCSISVYKSHPQITQYGRLLTEYNWGSWHTDSS